MNITEIAHPEAAMEPRLVLAKQGDAEAFCELCRFYEARLRRQAMALCGDPAAADDLAQEAFLAAWQSLSRYNERCRFFTWLCAILIHRYKSHRRGRHRAASRMATDEIEGDSENPLDRLADEAPRPDQALLSAEQALLMRRCLELLPAKHREVVFLRFYAQESLENIAVVLNCSVGTIKSRLFNALEKLRNMKGLMATLQEGEAHETLR